MRFQILSVVVTATLLSNLLAEILLWVSVQPWVNIPVAMLLAALIVGAGYLAAFEVAPQWVDWNEKECKFLLIAIAIGVVLALLFPSF